MNRLGSEKSPYLLQHRDNPIHWYAWGDDAFHEAARAHKPIFLSVGYSTCHWCHVMAHESFEDQEVAAFLNEHFVCIKVDREERPDVDQVYMTALQALTGGGGWPMSVWLDPDGKPFFAGTYFPKYRFMQLLRRIHQIWTEENDKLTEDSRRLTEVIRSALTNRSEETAEAEYEEFLKSYITHFHHHFDEQHGGFGGAPKFPQSMNLMVMMREDQKTGLHQAESMVTGTLDAMSRGGMYDHLAGGFHRYSVDERWLVPHFEKMLYDQALLSTTYLEAAQFYGRPDYAEVARETLDYVLREMTDANGGFYSAQDADSRNPESGHSEEGYFCTFTYSELAEKLSDEELAQLARAYGVSPSGNFEGRNILNLQPGCEREVRHEEEIVSAFEKLRELRAERPAPHLDDKIITGWNGWMIGSFAKAARVLGEQRYLKAAQTALEFFVGKWEQSGHLSRFWREGSWQAAAVAEDYASMIHACLEVYQSDFDARWAKAAQSLQEQMDQLFWSGDDGLYFANDGKDAKLPLRPFEDHDGVHPCSNSMAAFNLARLYVLIGEPVYLARAEQIFSTLFSKLKNSPSSLSYLALALDFHLAESKVAVLSGGGWTDSFYHEQASRFYPHVVWAKGDSGFTVTDGKSGGTPAIYVCEAGQCLKPAENANEAASQLQ